MYDNDAALTLFADAVDAKMGQLGSKRVALLKALAARRTSRLNPFPRRTSVRADLQSCMTARAFVTLATVAQVVSAEAEFELLVESTWDGNLEELVAVGRLLAEGESSDLASLVSLVVTGGWSSLDDVAGSAEIVSLITRCRIAAAADLYAAAKPEWLGRAEVPEAVDALEPAPSACDAVHLTPPINETVSRLQLPADRQAPSETATLEGRAGVMMTVSSLVARSRSPRRPVFGTMVERGVVSLIAAAPGTGKTMLSIQVVCAVASGKDWAGFSVPTHGLVVYLNAEDSGDEVARRFDAAIVAGLLDAEAAKRIFVVNRADHQRFMAKASGEIIVTEYGHWLRDAVAEIQPVLIVIDPMAMTHSLDENSNADMAALTGYFASLATFGNAGVLVVHHAGKDGKAGLGAARGASSIVASVRSMWHLYAPSEAGQSDLSVQLACVKSNHHPTGSTYSFRRAQVILANGDAVGVLEPVELGAKPRNTKD